jgi:hypothetical protein
MSWNQLSISLPSAHKMFSNQAKIITDQLIFIYSISLITYLSTHFSKLRFEFYFHEIFSCRLFILIPSFPVQALWETKNWLLCRYRALLSSVLVSSRIDCCVVMNLSLIVSLSYHRPTVATIPCVRFTPLSRLLLWSYSLSCVHCFIAY